MLLTNLYPYTFVSICIIILIAVCILLHIRKKRSNYETLAEPVPVTNMVASNKRDQQSNQSRKQVQHNIHEKPMLKDSLTTEHNKATTDAFTEEQFEMQYILL